MRFSDQQPLVAHRFSFLLNVKSNLPKAQTSLGFHKLPDLFLISKMKGIVRNRENSLQLGFTSITMSSTVSG